MHTLTHAHTYPIIPRFIPASVNLASVATQLNRKRLAHIFLRSLHTHTAQELILIPTCPCDPWPRSAFFFETRVGEELVLNQCKCKYVAVTQIKPPEEAGALSRPQQEVGTTRACLPV